MRIFLVKAVELCQFNFNSDQRYKTSINEYYNSLEESAGVLAHEIGHGLGISHDFTSSGDNRYDRNGVICTGINGVMDYGSRISLDKFTSCSKEDFKDFYNYMLQAHHGIFCLAQDCCKNYDLYFRNSKIMSSL